MTRPKTLLVLIAAAVVSACQMVAGGPGQKVGNMAAPGANAASGARPANAAPGTCWGKYTSPAVVETVTVHKLISPARLRPDGSVIEAAIYRTKSRQQIVKTRVTRRFQTPCPARMTPQFIASVQRALAARRLYRGPVSGTINAQTARAIRRFQKEGGLDSPLLSLQSARKLGLIAYRRTDQ